ncbi:putative NHN endonuclease [Variovorax sp. PBS-H4]|uniref:HNH endonuclease signature motif containing protein n=1 Tax=Variovorax sp. PBS-H4 TaxID=434008 RepID=UPI0013170E71|nr:HNH endonuclease signature motif containing protein [Variovorax sp. PBS-H4]VTU25429.1 putative NHN endonuclease [Variovorax sp. PBS-H4]
MASADLTAARLRELLHYDPETGVFTWRVTRPGGKANAGSLAGDINKKTGYRRIGILLQRHDAHRLAWLYVHGHWPIGMIDHIDGNQKNNAIANLRDVNHRTNQENLKRALSNNSTNLLGVSARRSRWIARIVIRGKWTYLGTFGTPEEAHAKYVMAKREHHEGCTI